MDVLGRASPRGTGCTKGELDDEPDYRDECRTIPASGPRGGLMGSRFTAGGPDKPAEAERSVGSE